MTPSNLSKIKTVFRDAWVRDCVYYIQIIIRAIEILIVCNYIDKFLATHTNVC